ncbi:CPBP family intramembrane metalloprotease [Tamlana agarivorans]|uniref:CPBP family intramembrane metalloprotease n=1 Tax=Pseudotamlana agarivorans TaxID=481183 RepID=A0ACC5UC86_9FLAO|nr:CPBP family intramembrane glutamic endopeptidase [Tamlana agarivorans]MBU2951936.1 CPBP family intramembrane metalloprotease [Tamlana agarivorans]
MYIEQAFKGLHEWWRYIVGVLIIFCSWQIIGMLPLVGALTVKAIVSDAEVEVSTIPEMIDLLGSNMFLFFMLFSFAVGLLGVFITSVGLHKLPIVSLTTVRKKIDWSRFWFVFVLWGAVSTGFICLEYYLAPEDYQWNFQLQPFLILFVIAVIFIPLQTSFEEYFFRGYLMQGFGIVFRNRWMPLLITSVGFGLMHIANPEVEQLGYVIMVYYIGTGLFLGIITLMDEGLELALGFHAANNLFTALLVSADWTAFQTHSLFKDLSDPSEMGLIEIFVPVFIVFPALLFVFSKKYNWTDWKGKLSGKLMEPEIENNIKMKSYDAEL